jgi:hypothetical protein
MWEVYIPIYYICFLYPFVFLFYVYVVIGLGYMYGDCLNYFLDYLFVFIVLLLFV